MIFLTDITYNLLDNQLMQNSLLVHFNSHDKITKSWLATEKEQSPISYIHKYSKVINLYFEWHI